MGYRVDYRQGTSWGSVIHIFTTRREAMNFAKAHQYNCNKLGGSYHIDDVKVARCEDEPNMGWLHGRLVRLHPLEF